MTRALLPHLAASSYKASTPAPTLTLCCSGRASWKRLKAAAAAAGCSSGTLCINHVGAWLRAGAAALRTPTRLSDFLRLSWLTCCDLLLDGDGDLPAGQKR
jgi:hypothetical protein